MKTIKKNITEIDDFQMQEIDQFIEDHFGLIFHETKFNMIVSESFKTQLSYFIVYNKKQRIIGICPVHTIKKGIVKQTYSNPAIFEVPYGGWIFDKSQISIDELLTITKMAFNESLTYWSSIQISDNKIINTKTIKKNYQTALIDLNKTQEDILMKVISKNTRHNIRRALKKDITIEKLNNEKFEIFCGLASTLKKKIGLKDDKNNFYKKLYSSYLNKKKIQAFAAKFQDNYISSLLCIGNKNYIHAWVAGRVNDLPKNIYQNELLWWESIKWAKEIGSRYYDLCIIEKERLPRIAVFKMGFSKNFAHFYYISNKSFIYSVLSRISKYLGITDG